MTLNQMFDFTPVYIYIVAAVQLFIGFSLSFAIGQILPLRIREFMYYLFSFLFLFIPFLYEIATANVQSGMRSFLFYLALLITIFLFTKESFLKKLSLFFILVFFDGILEIVICSLYWKGICEKLFGLHYTPYINVPNQKVSTILIFFLPVALAEIAFNFLFPLLWKRYIRFIHPTTFVEMILLPVLCTNGFLIFLPELFGMTGWILLFFILFVLNTNLAIAMLWELYEYMIQEAKKSVPVVEHGIFGADMKVSLINDGPFTIILDEKIL